MDKRDAKTVTRIQALENCVPELQGELDSLQIDDSGFINISQQVSRTCTKALYGTGTGG
jgi:hypothetical protein